MLSVCSNCIEPVEETANDSNDAPATRVSQTQSQLMLVQNQYKEHNAHIF